MLQSYVLTLIGDDKPGLVDGLARIVRAHGGNWHESRMANLAGKFSGIVLVSIPEDTSDEFENAVQELKQVGLSVRATKTSAAPRVDRHTRRLHLVANDRPGILSELSQVLAGLDVNVEELITDCTPAPMSGELLFNAKAKISMPDTVEETALQQALESLADDLMVEFEPNRS